MSFSAQIHRQFLGDANVHTVWADLADDPEAYGVNPGAFLPILKEIMHTVAAGAGAGGGTIPELNAITRELAIEFLKNQREDRENYADVDTDAKEKNKPIPGDLVVTRDRKSIDIIIHIDSRNRDVAVYRSPSRYRIQLANQGGITKVIGIMNDTIIKDLRNIFEIKVTRAQIPRINNEDIDVTDPEYIFLNLDEIKNPDFRTSFPNGFRVFGLLGNFYDKLNVRSFYTMGVENCLKQYDITQPLDSLANLTINLLNYNGELFDFGPDGLLITSIAPAASAVITTDIPHQLATNNRVYFRGITGTDVDAMLNRTAGFLVTVTGANTFTVPVTVTIGSNGGYVIVGKRQNNFTFVLKILAPEVAAETIGP